MRTFILTAWGFILAVATLTSCTSRTPPADQEQNELARLVESLTSPNKEPKLVGGEDGIPCKYQIPADFDLAAQNRIHTTWDQLSAKGIDAFPYLIDHFQDKRYCTSVETDDWWSNCSVGRVCRMTVRGHIEPWGEVVVDGGPVGIRPSYCARYLTTVQAAKRWYELHKGESLHKIQIESLEWTIGQEKQSKNSCYPKDIKYLAELLEQLRSSDKPFVPTSSSRGWWSRMCCKENQPDNRDSLPNTSSSRR